MAILVIKSYRTLTLKVAYKHFPLYGHDRFVRFFLAPWSSNRNSISYFLSDRTSSILMMWKDKHYFLSHIFTKSNTLAEVKKWGRAVSDVLAEIHPRILLTTGQEFSNSNKGLEFSKPWLKQKKPLRDCNSFLLTMEHA